MDVNSNSFRSRMQAPSTKIPEFNKLVEVSESVQNARQKTMGPPPAVNGVKRKTPTEQGGEGVRPAPLPPGSRVSNNTTKASSLANLNRQNSYSSSTSSRPNSSASSYRNASNTSSFSQSLGSGRSVYAQSSRPHTAMSSYSNAPKSHYPNHRSTSSLEQHDGNPRNTSSDGSNNSMRNVSSSSRQFSASRKKDHAMQESNDNQSEHYGTWSSSSITLRKPKGTSIRDISLNTHFGKLTLEDEDPSREQGEDNNVERIPSTPKTPSQIPTKKKSITFTPAPEIASPTKSCRKNPKPVGMFLNKSTNIQAADWDVNNRIERVESLYTEMKGQLEAANGERDNFKDSISLLKSRNTEVEGENAQLKRTNADMQRELDEMKLAKSSAVLALEEFTRKQTLETSTLKQELDDQRRAHNIELDDLARQKRRDIEDVRRDTEDELRNRDRSHREQLVEMKRKLEDALDEEKEQRRKELNAISSEGQMAQQRAEIQLAVKDKEMQALQDELEQLRSQCGRGEDLNRDLRAKFSEASTNIIALEAALRSSKARVEFLESDSKSQSQAFADLEQKTQDAIRESAEAKAKLRAEETLRRKLHNQVQELKGNIRVFCRVRPTLESDIADKARIEFPDAKEDSKEVEVVGPEEKSSLGTITTKRNAFSFDRVFVPGSQNGEVFDEISQLVQSALDGYNVCIFCYGQTGSGKTFTMSSDDGMIPRAVHQIYETAQSLEEKGWRYSMEGSFVEIYNENINDLLGKAEEIDKKKHEIRHDTQRSKTTITDVSTVRLDSPDKVHNVLKRAMSNRSVAATKANERSSRSHSVFILKLIGENHITGEKSEGTLNLVDLAGSERLSHSGATGERLKETQNINKSLSCLGDVIAALGQGKEGGHIPYRNSKLTYLLQYSLGGNSKTLMFVMISPLQAHLSETITSLKFATKVHNTHIGTAKRQAKVRD